MPDEFDYQDLDYVNIADLMADASLTLGTTSRVGERHILYGIVSESDGGIIAYAIGEDHARAIASALNMAVTPYEMAMGLGTSPRA
jgi:hypothetical protein